MYLKVIIKMYSSTNDNNDDSQNMKEKETIRCREICILLCNQSHDTKEKNESNALLLRRSSSS